MRKLYGALLLLALIALALPEIALASDISAALWKGTIRLTNSTSSTVTGASINATINSTALINNNYANATLTDVAIQYGGADIPFMPGYGNNPWILYLDSIGGNQILDYILYTRGASGGKTVYFPGTAGMTVSDNDTLEMGDNFELTVSGYTDNSSYIVEKENAFALTYDAATENVTATIYPFTVASDVLRFSNDTENSTASTTYVLLSTISLTSPASIARVKFDLKDGTNGSQALAKIYKNGVAIGTEQDSVSSTYATKSEDIALNAQVGDAIQVYGKRVGGTCWIKNFRIYYDVSAGITATGVSSGEYDEVTIDNPYAGGTPYKGNTHAHTTNSDGSLTPTQLVTLYKNLDYDFIAVTDHDYYTPSPGVSGIQFIRGVEETAVYSGGSGHLTALGVSSQISSYDAQTIITQIKTAGGIAGLNHPNYTFAPWGAPEIIDLTAFDFIEVFNGAIPDEYGSNTAEDKWDYSLSNPALREVWGVASDDYHNAGMEAKGYIVVYASSLSEANILAAIDAGNFYASTGAAISTITVSAATNAITITVPSSSTIEWSRSGGVVVQTDTAATTSTYRVEGYEGYVRAKVTTGSNFAWTQPFFIHREAIKVAMKSPFLSLIVGDDDSIFPPTANLTLNAPLGQTEENADPFTTIDANAYSFSVEGGATWSSDGYTLDGTGYLLHNAANFLSADSQGAIAIWFKSTQNAYNKGLWYSSDTATNTSYLGLDIEAVSNKLRWSKQDNGGTLTSLAGSTDVGNGVWHLAIISSNGTAYALYLDGNIEPFTVTGGSDNGDWFADVTLRDNFAIGSWIRTSQVRPYYGTIAPVMVYSEQLSLMDAQRIYNATKYRYLGTGVDNHLYSTTASVPANANDLVFFQNNAMSYVSSVSLSIDGTPEFNFEWQYGALFTDTLDNGYTATPTFRTASSNADVSASLVSLDPVTQAKIATFSLTSVYSILSGTPGTAGNMYTEGDYSKLPAEPINELLDASSVPRSAWWLPFLILGIGIIGFIVYGATTLMRGQSGTLYEGQIDGSLATMALIIEVLLVAAGTMGPIPLWPAILFPIPAVALILSKKHFSWG